MARRPAVHQQGIQIAITLMSLLLITGTVIFRALEGWSWVDSFYFTGATLLTIGYGDLAPTTDLTKILVIVFGFLAIGTFLYSVSMIGAAVLERFEAFGWSPNLLNRDTSKNTEPTKQQ